MTKHKAVSPKQTNKKNWHSLSRKHLWGHLVPLGFSLKPRSSKPPSTIEHYSTTFSSSDTLFEMVLPHVLTDCLRFIGQSYFWISCCHPSAPAQSHWAQPLRTLFQCQQKLGMRMDCVAAALLFCSQEGWQWWWGATKDTCAQVPTRVEGFLKPSRVLRDRGRGQHRVLVYCCHCNLQTRRKYSKILYILWEAPNY